MSVHICLRTEGSSEAITQWSYMLSVFGVTNIWERHGTKLRQARRDLASELPAHLALVVVSPLTARFHPGRVALQDFAHPEDVIYLFGGAHLNLSDEDDLGGRAPDATVHIPSVEHELYPAQAAAVVLWDRFVKRGGRHG